MEVEITYVVMTVMVSIAVTLIIAYNVMPRIYPLLRFDINKDIDCMWVCISYDKQKNRCLKWEKICWKTKVELPKK